MFGQNKLDDGKRFVRAFATNQLARLAPRTYVRLTAQTGRGSEEESAEDIAAYFRRCFTDYFRVLGVGATGIADYLAGKHVLEYGPGDVPGVALLMYAHGAERVSCVDRFPMVSFSAKNAAVLETLLAGLPEPQRARGLACLADRDDPRAGLAAGAVEYLVRRSGLSGLRESVDLIVSRAVLEHVDDLEATFRDMRSALRPRGIAVHQVDLKSHGLHRANPLDFLTWPVSWWQLMYSEKGVPNRWRVDRYRRALDEAELEVLHMEPTALAERVDIDSVRPHLAEPFRGLAEEDLAWLGFWLVTARRGAQLPVAGATMGASSA